MNMPNNTAITVDYHMHSTFSPDGDDPPESLCQRAIELGLTEIALTEHAEWHANWPKGGFPRAAAFLETIERCRTRFEPLGLTIHSGVEMGNPHQHLPEVNAFLATYPFDLVLGSLHWLDGKNIHLEECFTGRDPYDVYADYFTELGRMAAGSNFDLVAHFDRIIWRGTLLGVTFDPWRLEPIIRKAMATIAQNNLVLELNTRLLSHEPNWNEALVTILGWFKEAGGTHVSANSDAHRMSELGRNRDIAQKLLGQARFEVPQQLLQINDMVRTFSP